MGGNVWGVNAELWWGPRWGCCLHIPAVGQMRRPCRKPPPWARGWIFRSYRLIVRQKRKWNSEVNHILLFLDQAWKWADNPAPSWVRLGISSTNGYVQAYMYISDYLGNLSKNRQKLSLKSKNPHFKIRCSCVNSLLSQLLKMSALVSLGWLMEWMNSDSIMMTHRCKCSYILCVFTITVLCWTVCNRNLIPWNACLR